MEGELLIRGLRRRSYFRADSSGSAVSHIEVTPEVWESLECVAVECRSTDVYFSRTGRLEFRGVELKSAAEGLSKALLVLWAREVVRG